MKLSFLAAIAAVALATTSDAANSILSLYNEQGTCNSFPVYAYNTCYQVSKFWNAQAAGYVSADGGNDNVSISFFESNNCGDNYTRVTGKMTMGKVYSWNSLGQVSGSVGSVWVQNSITTNEEGYINQALPSSVANWKNKC